MTGLPGPDPSDCGFVELEDARGAGVGPGTSPISAEWSEEQEDGTYLLEVFQSYSTGDIKISREVLSYVDQLVEIGLHGATREEVISRLVCQGVERAITSRLLVRR
jgi:hypothetical protein